MSTTQTHLRPRPPRWLPAVALVAVLGLAGIASAAELPTIDRFVGQDQTTVTIPWSELLQPGQSHAPEFPGEAPRFGSLSFTPDALVYTPRPDFFLAGGDAFSFVRRDNIILDTAIQPVVLSFRGSEVWDSFSENAESGDLSQWDVVEGDVAITEDGPLQGTASIRFQSVGHSTYISRPGPELQVGVTLGSNPQGGTSTSNGHVGMVVDLDPPPPPPPGSTQAGAAPGTYISDPLLPLRGFRLYEATDASGELTLSIQVRYLEVEGEYVIRATTRDEQRNVDNGGTRWLPLPTDGPVRIDAYLFPDRIQMRVASGDSVEADSVEVNGLLETQLSTQYLGMLNAGRGTATLKVDGFVQRTWQNTGNNTVRRHVDGFENGLVSPPWLLIPATTNALSNVASPGLGGDFSLVMDVDEVVHQADARATLVHRLDAPRDHWVGSFRIDTSTLDLPDWKSVLLLGGSSEFAHHANGAEHLRLWVTRVNGQDRFFARTVDASGQPVTVPMVTVPSAQHTVTVQWQGGSRVGALRLWVDDQPVAAVHGFDASGLDIESVRFGAMGLVPELGDQDRSLVLDGWASWSVVAGP
ncbi:MAG: hypothetical protein AAGD06_22085 [Acidobacteriota bacterium]